MYQQAAESSAQLVSPPVEVRGCASRGPNSPPVVGTPREQFEEGLAVLEWHAYMDVRGQHNM